MQRSNEKGVTMVLAILLMTLFLTLTVSLSFNARSETQMSNGIKLSQYYNLAARSALDRTRSNLSDYWIAADPYTGTEPMRNWRFGTLLTQAQAGTTGDFGGLMPPDQWNNVLEMNGGLLQLTYNVWIANNGEDPAYSLAGLTASSDTVDPAVWDMDGKIVATIEVYGPDGSTILATHTALIGLSGADFVTLHDDAVREGDIYEAGNLGRGSLGSNDRLDFDTVRGDLTSN